MSGHTPGPWRAIRGEIYAAETMPVHGGKTCIEVGHDPCECGESVISPIGADILQEIKDGYWDNVDSPLDADLVLAAAAPELLEALEDLASLAEAAMREVGEYDIEAELADARAAIAKATGGAG